MSHKMMEKGWVSSKSNGSRTYGTRTAWLSERCTIECFIHKRRTKPACLSWGHLGVYATPQRFPETTSCTYASSKRGCIEHYDLLLPRVLPSTDNSLSLSGGNSRTTDRTVLVLRQMCLWQQWDRFWFSRIGDISCVNVPIWNEKLQNSVMISCFFMFSLNNIERESLEIKDKKER